MSKSSRHSGEITKDEITDLDNIIEGWVDKHGCSYIKLYIALLSIVGALEDYFNENGVTVTDIEYEKAGGPKIH